MVTAQTSAKLSAAAKSIPRDANGRFIKKANDPVSAATTTVATATPLPTITTPPPAPTLP